MVFDRKAWQKEYNNRESTKLRNKMRYFIKKYKEAVKSKELLNIEIRNIRQTGMDKNWWEYE